MAGGVVEVQTDGAGGLDHPVKRLARRPVPSPRVLKRLDLSGRPRAVPLRKQQVVILIALERRIEIDQIHRLVLHVPPQHVEVVAVVEEVVGHG